MNEYQLRVRRTVDDALGRANGILRLNPAWVARTFLPPGKRFGLPERDYALGERGAICERWLTGASADRKWLIRHAVRHPAKKVVQAALRLRQLAK